MSKQSKPDNVEQVKSVMLDYCQRKGFNLAASHIEYLAEDCHLFFEAKGWVGVKYWPALAMRWVLTDVKRNRGKDKQGMNRGSSQIATEGETIRDRIIRGQNEV